MKRLGLAVVCLLLLPATAEAPTTQRLEAWQAKRIARSHAKLQDRPGFRVESIRRTDRYKVRVCWSEPGYLLPDDGRDFGCDRVELRGRQFWIYDDSVLGAGWVRWL